MGLLVSHSDECVHVKSFNLYHTYFYTPCTVKTFLHTLHYKIWLLLCCTAGGGDCTTGGGGCTDAGGCAAGGTKLKK